jgi:hypothetical protein
MLLLVSTVKAHSISIPSRFETVFGVLLHTSVQILLLLRLKHCCECFILQRCARNAFNVQQTCVNMGPHYRSVDTLALFPLCLQTYHLK